MNAKIYVIRRQKQLQFWNKKIVIEIIIMEFTMHMTIEYKPVFPLIQEMKRDNNSIAIYQIRKNQKTVLEI